MPVLPYGAVADNVYDLATQITVSSGTTAYVGSAGFPQAVVANGAILMNVAGTVRNLEVGMSTAPGAGPVTYTVYKNGAATSMQVVLSGTGAANQVGADQNPAHNFSVNIGDFVAVQVVTTTTSSIAYHYASFSVLA